MLTEIKRPYEALFRWDDAGNLRGAHVRWRTVVLKDDVEIASREGPPEYVAVAGADGYPLADIMEQVTKDALTHREEALAELTQTRQQRDQANLERDAAMKRATDAEARADAMRAALGGRIEQQQAALAADEEARALLADAATGT